MNVVETENLVKRFRGGVDAVNGLDLAIEEGSVFGLIGPNGAGKTTTLRILMNLLRPTSGRARSSGPRGKRPRSSIETPGRKSVTESVAGRRWNPWKGASSAAARLARLWVR